MTTRKGGHFRRGWRFRRPVSAALPRCHCEARSAAAIRSPSTNLRQNRNNSPQNFVHLFKMWKFRRKRLRKLGFFDRLARRPARGAALFFWGVCTCRAGPMCPAARYAFFGGARGPRPTGRYVEPRVGDAVPYDFCAGRGGGAKPSSAAKIYSYCTKNLLSFLSQCHLTNPLKKV